MGDSIGHSEEAGHRKRGAILGAIVADAASMGLHWIYDVERIRKAGGVEPEFKDPDPANYEGVQGYFAHGQKRSGDLSNYGEQLLVMLRTLSQNKGFYNGRKYQKNFRDHFGPGGPYQGYIDAPTRDTLKNLEAIEAEAIEKAAMVEIGTDDELKGMLVRKILPNVKIYEGEELRKRVDTAIRITIDDDEIVKKGFSIMESLEDGLKGYCGADDQQLPAISKLPPLIACHAGTGKLEDVIEDAVRVTNNNDLAVPFAFAAGKIIENAILGESVAGAIQSALQIESDEVSRQLIKGIQAAKKDSIEVIGEFGRDCGLRQGMAGALQILASANSYKQAVRTNILAGGDSCGRAILIGSVMGAVHGIATSNGIPLEWIVRLNETHTIVTLVERCLFL
ncbi:ADP-ribosylglycohydrolase family protein [Thermodesulfobacteriota bacterium]